VILAQLVNDLSADDGCDVGEDRGSPVSPDYGWGKINGKAKSRTRNS
jgi:hypothetical protein